MSESTSGPAPATVDARLTDVVARFGEHLSPAQREHVRSRIERTLTIATALRRVPLTNADEPEIVFAPYRGEA